MSMNEKRLGEILSALDAAERGEHSYFGKKKGKTPSRKEVVSIIKGMQALMFPDYFKVGGDESTADGTLREVYNKLKEQISLSIKFSQSGCNESEAALLADEIIGTLPKIKAALIKDIEAIFGREFGTAPNTFAIRSYMKYRYLLLIENEKDSEGRSCILGAPGIFNNNDNRVAGMCGFKEFRPSKNAEKMNCRFGYWLKEMKL